MALAAGTQLGPYEILAPIGAGGMGEVYRARDKRLDRDVAVKILPPHFAGDLDRRQRFEREAKAVAALSHPNILALHDVGSQSEITFLVLELLEGESLRERLRPGPLPWRKAVELGAGIADGLSAAHAKGVIHRDLKPENLFVTTDGRVKILDFGLARVGDEGSPHAETGPYSPSPTQTGTVMGTVGYMSPEQVRGQAVDARSDIFSLGCVLHEMISGRPPFARETSADTQTAILREEPPPLAPARSGVAPELDRVVAHCLEKNKEERFQTARDLAFALRASLSPSGSLPTVSQRKTFPWLVGLAALAVAACISGGIYLYTRNGPDPEPTPPASSGQAFESVAILPLVKEKDVLDPEGLCDGIPDSLTSSLIRIEGSRLKVRPMAATAHYRGEKVDPRSVGRDLDVRAVITGRFRRQNKSLTVSLELIDTRDNNLLWSKQYQRSVDEILILQDEMARDVTVRLGLRLSGQDEQQLTKRYTNDDAAYLLYREGRLHFDKFTEEGLETSIKHFQAAIKKDPKFALAYAAEAGSHEVLAINYRSPKEYWRRGKELAGTALQLDESLSDAHSALGSALLFFERDVPTAQREFREALRLEPKNLTARVLYSFSLAAQGKANEAVAEREQILKDNPRFNGRPLAYVWARRYEDAVKESMRILHAAPDSRWTVQFHLGQGYAGLGKVDEAIAAYQEALKPHPTHAGVLGSLGHTHARAGNRPEALRIIEQLKQQPVGIPRRGLGLAEVYAGLGDKDQAFHWLNEAADNPDAWIVFIKVEPAWDSLRDDPRYDALLQRLGLADKAAAKDAPLDTLAVLPFENQSTDPAARALDVLESAYEAGNADFINAPIDSVWTHLHSEPRFQALLKQMNFPP